jgi:tetratricopeptide (TPR) repeat protein
MKKIAAFFKRVFIFFFLLIAVILVYSFSETLLKYVFHGKAFYQVYLGDKAYKQEDFSSAINHYEKAVKLYPKHLKARYNLANIYVRYEDFPSAVNQYREVLKHNPSYLNAGINLGIVLSEELLDFDGAIAEYQKVIKAKTRIINIPYLYDNRKHVIQSKAIAYYNMGLAYRDKSMLFAEDSGKYNNLLRKAAECYEKCLDLDKNNYDARYNLAITKHILGYYTDALTNYCKALLIFPLDYEAHYNLAMLLRQKRMYQDSFNEFKQAGLLMDYAGDSFKAAFIYSMLNEVSQMAIAEYGYKPKEVLEKLNSGISEPKNLSRDKYLSLEELEKVLIKKIKTNSVCKDYLK